MTKNNCLLKSKINHRKQLLGKVKKNYIIKQSKQKNNQSRIIAWQSQLFNKIENNYKNLALNKL